MKNQLKKTLSYSLLVPVLIFAFQNCAPTAFNLSSDNIELSSVSEMINTSKVNPFVCDGKTIEAEKMRRLNRIEIQNTLKSLLGSTIFTQIEPTLGALYSDTIEKSVDEVTHTIDGNQAFGYKAVAERVYVALSMNASLLASLGAACANLATVTNVCRDEIIKNLGLKAFRRPLTTSEIVMFQNQVWPLGDTGAERVGWILYTLILSPDFLLHIERGVGTGDERVASLTSYEVASRISFMITDSPPDEALYLAASKNELATDEQISPHIDRLFTTSAAKEKIHRFFQFWVSPKSLQTRGYADDFLAGFNANEAIPEYNRELKEFIEHIIFTQNGSFQDLLMSRAAFPRNDAVASVLGARKLASAETTPSLTGPERMGLLMRPSVLATEGNEVHTILRGAKFRIRFLCDNLGFPAGALLAGDPSFSSDSAKAQFSARHRTEKLTNSVSCMGCHSTINPAGFAFENFDNFGRLRSVEKTYTSNGAVLGMHNIDTQVLFKSDVRASPVLISDGVQMIQLLLTQNQLPSCFVKQMHRFYRLRQETANDQCVLNKVYKDLAIDPNKSLMAAFKSQILNLATIKKIRD